MGMMIVLIVSYMLIKFLYYNEGLYFIRKFIKKYDEACKNKEKSEGNFIWLKQNTIKLKKIMNKSNILNDEIAKPFVNNYNKIIKTNNMLIENIGEYGNIMNSSMMGVLYQLEGNYNNKRWEIIEVDYWIDLIKDFPKKIFNYIFGENFPKFGNAINAVVWIAIVVVTLKNTNINNMDSVTGALKEIIKIGK